MTRDQLADLHYEALHDPSTIEKWAVFCSVGAVFDGPPLYTTIRFNTGKYSKTDIVYKIDRDLIEHLADLAGESSYND